jgi:hypothetical protein
VEYVERPVYHYVDRIKEVPYEKYIEVPVPEVRIVKVPVERIVF